MENKILPSILAQVVQSFWQSAGFWILLILVLIIIAALVFFYFEINTRDKNSDRITASSRLQNIMLEYQTIIHKLDQLNIDIEFPEARDLCSEINRRVRRLTAAYKADPEYQEIIAAIHQSLEAIKSSLTDVRPVEMRKLSDTAVYFAIEAHFSELGGHLSELMGLFEKQSSGK